jgi:hypothetical protein
MVVLRSGWMRPSRASQIAAPGFGERGAGIPRAVGGVAEHPAVPALVLQQPHHTTPSSLDDAEQVIG